jgi:hypothetical protein
MYKKVLFLALTSAVFISEESMALGLAQQHISRAINIIQHYWSWIFGESRLPTYIDGQRVAPQNHKFSATCLEVASCGHTRW